jgi:hypothetical protein
MAFGHSIPTPLRGAFGIIPTLWPYVVTCNCRIRVSAGLKRRAPIVGIVVVIIAWRRLKHLRLDQRLAWLLLRYHAGRVRLTGNRLDRIGLTRQERSGLGLNSRLNWDRAWSSWVFRDGLATGFSLVHASIFNPFLSATSKGIFHNLASDPPGEGCSRSGHCR